MLCLLDYGNVWTMEMERNHPFWTHWKLTTFFKIHRRWDDLRSISLAFFFSFLFRLTWLHCLDFTFCSSSSFLWGGFLIYFLGLWRVGFYRCVLQHSLFFVCLGSNPWPCSWSIKRHRNKRFVPFLHTVQCQGGCRHLLHAKFLCLQTSYKN